MGGPSTPHSAETLYLQLRSVGLDRARVYRVRGASIHRAAMHITLDDGTIAFTEDVAGRVTGAFFEGDGETLLIPPNRAERSSMSIFTGAAILEEKFVTAYFRFNDDTFSELQPWLRPAESQQEFFSQWNESARNLAEEDALRLLLSFSQLLPASGQVLPQTAPEPAAIPDRMLHARVQGRTLGVFDLYFDSMAWEEVSARTTPNAGRFDLLRLMDFVFPEPTRTTSAGIEHDCGRTRQD